MFRPYLLEAPAQGLLAHQACPVPLCRGIGREKIVHGICSLRLLVALSTRQKKNQKAYEGDHEGCKMTKPRPLGQDRGQALERPYSIGYAPVHESKPGLRQGKPLCTVANESIKGTK